MKSLDPSAVAASLDMLEGRAKPALIGLWGVFRTRRECFCATSCNAASSFVLIALRALMSRTNSCRPSESRVMKRSMIGEMDARPVYENHKI